MNEIKHRFLADDAAERIRTRLTYRVRRSFWMPVAVSVAFILATNFGLYWADSSLSDFQPSREDLVLFHGVFTFGSGALGYFLAEIFRSDDYEIISDPSKMVKLKELAAKYPEVDAFIAEGVKQGVTVFRNRDVKAAKKIALRAQYQAEVDLIEEQKRSAEVAAKQIMDELTQRHQNRFSS